MNSKPISFTAGDILRLLALWRIIHGQSCKYIVKFMNTANYCESNWYQEHASNRGWHLQANVVRMQAIMTGIQSQSWYTGSRMYERSTINVHSGFLMTFCHSTPIQLLIHFVLFHLSLWFSSLSHMWICPIQFPPCHFLEGNERSLDVTHSFSCNQTVKQQW